MLLSLIDENQAKETAKNFLQQHYSVNKIERTVLKDGVWIVDVLVSVPNTRIINVKINAKTGFILGWQ